MSGLFRSTTIKGTRITDFAQTSANVGSTIPFLYGRAPVTGNVIFAALPPKESRQVKRQGKGGVKQESFTYTTSYAIAFCRGPILGYWWIKRNGKVVYSQDPNAPIEDQEYAAKWAAKVSMYNGTLGQLPNSTIESYKGTGAVSAFRGLAYIVVPNEDVTDGGGAIPSYEAVPIASPTEVWFTSKPYAQFARDTVSTGARLSEITLLDYLNTAASNASKLDCAFAPDWGQLFEVIPPTIRDSGTATFVPNGGNLKFPPLGRARDEASAALAPTDGKLIIPPSGTIQRANVTAAFQPDGGELKSVATLVALLHMDGADGSSVFTDETGKTWTVTGNARIRTAQAKFGQSVGFDGSASWLSAPSGPEFNFGMGDFTWECFAYWTGNGNCALLSIDSNWTLYRATDNNLWVYNGTTAHILGGGFQALNVWDHIALTRAGGTLRLFRNGVLLSSASYPNNLPSNNFVIGASANGAYTYMKGYIDEVRIHRGVALYTASFTPPSTPFTYP